jgi:hypothetical protein
MLFAGLSQLMGEQIATQAWYMLRSVEYLRKTGDWTDVRNKNVRIPRTLQGEPTLDAALQVLGLGSVSHVAQHMKLVENWNGGLKRIPGRLFEYEGNRKLAKALDKQLTEVSGPLYKKLLIVYNPVTARIEIRPRPEAAGAVVSKADGSKTLTLEEYVTKDGPNKVSDVLQRIADSNIGFATIAEHLLQFSEVNNIEITTQDSAVISANRMGNSPIQAIGIYDPSANEIVIARNSGARMDQILIHEILHALSWRKLQDNVEISSDFRELYQYAKKHLGGYLPATKEGIYGMYNEDEFFVALFTNGTLIKKLQELPAMDGRKYDNLLQQIMDFLLNAMNINKENPTLYTEAFAAATNILNESLAESKYLAEWMNAWDSLPDAIVLGMAADPVTEMAALTNHSGGAKGSDTAWDRIGRTFGVTNHKHYWHGTLNPLSKPEDEVNDADFAEGKEKVMLANQTLKRKPEKYMDLLARNWMQVKNSDAVFAIGKLTSLTEVKGGTGWAVQMAIDAGKPVNVFDQEKGQWFKWDGNKFVWQGTPTLTKNFAGIGTRELTPSGEVAIKNVYEHTQNVFTTGMTPSSAKDAAIGETVVKNSTYEGLVTALGENQVFVFGANNQGLHGAGAAAVAAGREYTPKEFPSVRGTKGKWVVLGEHSKISTGTEGKSYPLVTVEGKLGGKNAGNRMPDERVIENMRTLYQTAMENPTMQFLIGYTSHDRMLSGFSAKEMANMFVKAGPIPDNIIFEKRFRGLMDNLAVRFIASDMVLQDQTLREPLSIDEQLLRKARAEQFVEIRNADGSKSGRFFDQFQQTQATDSIIYLTAQEVNKSKRVDVKTLKDTIEERFKLLLRIYQTRAAGKAVMVKGTAHYTHITPEMGATYARNMEDVLYSLKYLMKATIRRLAIYGIKVNELDSNGATDQLTDGELVSTEAKAIENFNDLIFTLDPKATASGRLKLYIAATENVEEGPLLKPKVIGLPLGHVYIQQILDGTRKYSVRTPKQLADIGLSLKPGDSGSIKLGDTWYVVRPVKPMTAQEAKEYNEGDQRENLDFMRTGPDGTAIAAEKHEAKEGDVLLEIVPFVEERGLVNIPSFIGTPTLAELENLYDNVTGMLANTKPSFDKYMEILESGSPVLRKLAQRLKSSTTPEQIRREFVTVMTKSYTQYALIQYKLWDDNAEIRTINANIYSARKLVLENWKQAQKRSPMVKRTESGYYIIDPAKVDELKADYEELKAKNQRRIEGAKGPGAAKLRSIYFKAAKELVTKMFEYNGIMLTPIMYETLYKSGEEMLIKEWSEKKDGGGNGIFSMFLLKLLNTKDEEGIENTLEKNNPLYSENTTMNMLSRIYVRHADMLYNSSHRDLAGNNVWDYILNSYLSNAFLDLVDESGVYREQLKNTDFARNNWLLQVWENDPSSRRKADLLYLEGLKKMKGKAASERTDMSDRDQLFMALGMYMNNGWESSHYVSLTHSDKSRTPVFMNIPRTPTGAVGKPSLVLMERLYSVFESEFDRIANSAEHIYDDHQQYEQGKKFFFMMPQFNYANMKARRDAGEITEEELGTIWISDGVINAPGKGTEAFDKLVKRMLNEFITEETAIQLRKFNEAGMVDMTTGKHLFNERYIKEVANTQAGISVSRKDVYIVDKRRVDRPTYLKALSEFVAMNYAMNAFLVNTSMAQLLYGDPAQVYKKSVADTLIEYEKRLAGPIAPGKETEWTAEQMYYDIIVLDDYTVALDYIKGIPAYKDVNVTDAQEFVTMEEHLDVMFRFGMLAEDTYNEMIALVRDPNFAKFTRAGHERIALQITKPVYYGKRPNVDRGALLHDYVKSSAIPLYAGFTAGTELDKLRKDMEKRGIRRAQFISAKKIGAGKPFQAFGKNGNYNSIEFAPVQRLSREGFRIQQEVPYDRNKDMIQIFSQANKLIVSDLPENFSVTLMDGQTYNRDNIREKKEALRIQMVQENIEEFKEELDIEAIEGKFRFRNPAKFIKRLIDEGKKKSYSENELAPLTHLVDGRPISPLFFTSLSDPLHNLMMSMIDGVVKTKVPGKSYVQASSVGITRMLTGLGATAGITWVPGYDGSRELRMPVLNEDGTVTPAEILVPFHFFQDGQKMVITEFLLEDGTLDMSRLPLEVLEMVGIRIPTSKHNTMLPMKIVGFLPDNMGDAIIVPPGITTQMGSDFDVDKLFVYRRPYTITDKAASATDGIMAEYFDLHFKILTAASVYPVMMSPLDKPDLKDEAKKLAKPSAVGNFFGASSQLADFISQKDAKSLVGFGAQTNQFLATIQHLDLKLGTMEYNEETKEMVEIPTPIEIFKDEDGVISLVNLSGYGTSVYVPASGIPETRTKMDNINIMLQEFLDHAKHRTIDKINLTVHTYPAAAGILSLETEEGKAVNTTYVSRMLSQPIIRQFNLLMERGQDMLSGYVPNLEQSVFDQLYTEISKKIGEGEPVQAKAYTAKELLDMANKPKNTREYYLAQRDILRAFQEFHAVGTRMSEMAALTTQDVKGTDGSLFKVIDKDEKAGIVLGPDVILGGNDLLSGEKGFLFDTVNSLALSLFDNYLPHSQVYLHTLTHIKSYTNRKSMTQISEEIQKSVMKGIRSYVYSEAVRQALGVEDITAERARLYYATENGPSLAERVAEAQLSWGKNNFFLSRLHTDLGNGLDPHSVNFIAAKVTRMDDAENVRAWLDLLLSPDKNVRMLGEDLVRYAFLTGGVQDAQSFVRYVPFGYLAATNWFNVLQSAQNNMDSMLSSGVFTEQWFRHNPEKAISIDTGFKETGRTYEGVPEFFSFPYPDPDLGPTAEQQKYIVTIGIKKYFTPYISHRTESGDVVLYKKLTENEEAGIQYARIDTLGNRMSDEYNLTEPTHRSIVTDNRAFNLDWQVADNQAPAVLREGNTVVPNGQRPVEIEQNSNVHPIYTQVLGITKEVSEVEDINDTIIPHMLNSGTLPGVYHTLLTELHNFSGSQEFQDLIEEITYDRTSANRGPNSSGRLQIGFASGRPAYLLPENSIILQQVTPGASLRPDAAAGVQETFVHELMHWATLPMIEFAYRRTKGESTSVFEKHFDYNDPVMQSARHIVKLWEFARKGHEGEYWASSPHEFVAHATTNAETMKILNDMKYDGERSVLEAVWDFLNTLFNNIANMIGEPVKHDSVLAEALPHIIHVMKQGGVTEILTAGTVEYNDRDVIVGVRADGVAVKVHDSFMHGMPEPVRQKAISEVLGLYGKPEEDEDSVPWIEDGTEYTIIPGQPPVFPKIGKKPAENKPEVGMSRYELFPGVFANEKQREAIDRIPAFIGDVDSKLMAGENIPFEQRVFVLSGAGGTGKTTILRKVLAEFADRKMVITAPSHNAIVELKSALGKVKETLPNAKVDTIHAQLDLKRNAIKSMQTGTDVFEQKRGKFKKPLRSSSIIVVDESSMLDDTLMNYLKQDAPDNAVVIFMGDYAQLTPVGQVNDSLPFREYINTAGISLTQNMRTNKADVVTVLNAYRAAIDGVRAGTGTYKFPVVAFPNRVSSENVSYLSSREDFFNSFMNELSKDMKNPKNALMIVSTNKVREEFNLMVRTKRFGEAIATSTKISAGDIAIFNSAHEPTRLSAETAQRLGELEAKADFFNMQRVIVESVVPGRVTKDTVALDRDGEPWFAVKVDLPGFDYKFDLGSELENIVVETQGITKDTYYEIKNRIEGDKRKGEPNRYVNGGFNIPADLRGMSGGADFLAYPKYVAMMEALSKLIVDIEPAYTVTSHKSQGSTYNHVFVHEYNFIGPAQHKFSDKEVMNGMYTAVSRTKEHLYILHPANPKTVNLQANSMLLAASATVADGTPGPWTFRNEVEAAKAAKVLEERLQIKTEREGVNIIVHANPKALTQGNPKKPKSLSAELNKIISALEQQKETINNSMAGTEDRAAREEKKLQIKKIDDGIQSIKDHANLTSVAEFGKQQLAWIRSIAETTADQTEADLVAAWRVSDVWGNMLSILYPDGTLGPIDPALAEVSSTAEGLRKKLDARLRDAMLLRSEGALKRIDFGSALKDMDTAAALAYSLNHSSSQLVQQIDLLLKNAGRRKGEDVNRLINKLQALEQQIDAFGKREEVYEMMLQSNETGSEFGLVQKYSTTWFSTLSELRGRRKSELQGISGSPMDKKNKAKAYKKTWDRYWTQIKKIGVYVDVTKVLDENGNFLPDITAERTRLIGELGTELDADNAIEQARNKYMKYLADYDVYTTAVEQRMHEGTLTRDEADKEIYEYAETYSPRRFFTGMNDPNQQMQLNHGDRYAILLPRKSRAEFYDEKYEYIQKTEPLKKIYDDYSAIMKELKGYLPVYVQWDMYDNFLPAVEKHLMEDTSIKDYAASMGRRVMDSISATEFEQDKKRRIPIRYVYRQPEAEMYSRDLIRIAELFGIMALHYRHFAAVKDAVDMGEIILTNIHIERSKANNTDQEILTNTLKALEYAKDYLMYQKTRDLEGNTGMKLYSPNPVVHRQIVKKVKDLLIQRAELEDRMLDPQPGDSMTHLSAKMETIDKELTEYEKMGQNVYLSKLGDRLIGINQLKALAFNPFSGFANLAFGMASMSIYANGNKDFTMKTAMKAMGMMTNSTRKYFTFGKGGNAMTNKIMALMERSGMMGDIVDSQYGESNLASRKNKVKKALDPYTFLRSSDYYMKGSIMIATMLETKVEVTTESGEKKTIPLWEAFDENGKWLYKEDPAWYSADVTQQQSWEKFRNRTIRISQIIMGNMDKNSPKQMNKYILGRLIGQFRASWLTEGWAARWAEEKFDQQLDRKIKGRYRTYMDIGMEGSIKVMLRQFAGWFGNTDYFSGVTMTNGRKLANSEVDMDNMRRNFTGMMWTLSMMGAVLALTAVMGEGDDDDSITKESLMIILNMMNRVNQDLQFYSSPDVANNLVRNTIPAFDVINDYIKAVKATKKAIMSEDYDWDQAALKWTKATPYLNQINRVRFLTTHDISTISR